MWEWLAWKLGIGPWLWLGRMRWSTTPPTEEGDYLWFSVWGCRCFCVRAYGYCFIEKYGNDLYWNFDRKPHKRGDGTYDCQFWLKLENPMPRDFRCAIDASGRVMKLDITNPEETSDE